MGLKAWLPRRRSFDIKDGRVSSMRWRGWGWDHFVSRRGFQYTQWGRGVPLHFICRFDSACGRPTFTLGSKWTITQKRPGMVAGTTHAPLEVSKLWRRLDGSGQG